MRPETKEAEDASEDGWDEVPLVDRLAHVIEGFSADARTKGVVAVLAIRTGLLGNPIGVELTDFFAETPGTGAGTQVMRALIERADTHSVSLTVHPSSGRNRDFYTRFGFVLPEGALTEMVRHPPLPGWLVQEQQENAASAGETGPR